MGTRAACMFAAAIILAGTAAGGYAIGHTHLDPLAAAPTWADQTTAIATGATALILLITAFFALRGVEDARRTRHGQLVLDLTRQWDQPTVIEAGELHAALGKGAIVELLQRVFERQAQDTPSDPEIEADLETYWKLMAIPNLIDMIGVLESEGVISARLVHKMWGPLILSAWDAWGGDDGGLAELRTHYRQYAEETFAYFERLALKMVALENRQRRS
jgi:hypothetical protein